MRLVTFFRGFDRSRAVCAWGLPAHARGEVLRGSIEITVTPRARVARHFALVVR
jgi:hypothetical protein